MLIDTRYFVHLMFIFNCTVPNRLVIVLVTDHCLISLSSHLIFLLYLCEGRL